MVPPHPLPPAAMRIVDWLGDVGPRWGLPADACRVHALLFLTDRPQSEAAIGDALRLGVGEIRRALDWLDAEQQVERNADGWRTGTDPWVLMVKSLEVRRSRELAAVRPVIERWRGEHDTGDPIVAQQAQKLFALIDDIAAIDAGARLLSPAAARRLIGLGGRTARLLDRAIGRRTGR